MSKGSPKLTFRLPVGEREALSEMSKLYGSANVSEFLREMVGAMCSGELERVKAFNVQLMSKAGEQTALDFHSTAMSKLDELAGAHKRAVRGKGRKKGGRRARRP